MRRTAGPWTIALTLAVACASANPPQQQQPQTPETASRIEGVVLDPDGLPAAGAVVVVRGEPRFHAVASSATGGRFSLPVPPGAYDVTAWTQYGFALRRGVVVSAGHLRIRLRQHARSSCPQGHKLVAPRLLTSPRMNLSAGDGAQESAGAKCVITAEGIVRGCMPLTSGSEVDGELADLFERRTYRPALCDGAPIEVDYTISLKP
jgi:hypothetical protein